MRRNLIVFIKNPELGHVKTRLAKTIGDEKALIVYKDLLNKCRFETSKVGANRYLFYSKKIKEDDWSIDLFKKNLQHKGDLGDRIEAAFYNIYKGKEEEEKTLIIGSDCFDLTAEIIEEAFEKLESSNLVLGPSNDGGYYLLGTKRFFPLLFEGISWSTSSVFQQTIEQAKKLGLKIEVLKELVDIDNIEDIKASSYELGELEYE